MPVSLTRAAGEPMPACVRATITATMAAPQAGLARPAAVAWLGRVEIVDLGAPSPRG